MTAKRKRTAVLVVHGIGSQRAQNTVRGVVDAVWFDGDNPSEKKVWTHPERSGIDLDLTVMTTSKIPGTADERSADFHEFYWAHLMSETKAVAVLLWLYELGRKGPHFKHGMNGLWWGAAIFLCLMNLSFTLLLLQAVTKFVQLDQSIHKLVITPYLMAFLLACMGIYGIYRFDLSSRLPRANLYLLAVCLVPVLSFVILAQILTAVFGHPISALKVASWITDAFLPVAIALLATVLLMGKWGLKAFAWPFALSFLFLALYLGIAWASGEPLEGLFAFKLPWSIGSQSSAVAAFLIVGLYLAVNAAFLQPYLGDAARYFRNSPANVAVRRKIRKQAVQTLEQLHTCGEYDRIVIVAHSLGSVVAYDMLRAYYSRINQDLPDGGGLGPSFDAVDQGTLSKAAARESGREIIRCMAAELDAAKRNIDVGTPRPGDEKMTAWLVTDFVTLGCPLTHVLYLMCNGDGDGAMQEDFERRTRERELPTCPPRKLGPDRRLTFLNPNEGKRRFHHGGQFALTRWTNLYFPRVKLFWGDAIGGPVADIFGDADSGGHSAQAQDVVDVAVYTNSAGTDDFFSHTLYWHVGTNEKYQAPHIVALKRAIDLGDTGAANGM